jgi:hypothetical protein
MIVLTGDWQLIKNVAGGQVLVTEKADRILVSFPEDMSEDDLCDVLADAGIEVVGPAGFEYGEAEGESVAIFSKPI